MTEQTRQCKKCGEVKSLSSFNFRSDSQTYRWDCKECLKAYRRKQYESNKEGAAKQAREWRNKNYEYWQRSRAEYYRKNKDAFRVRCRNWNKKNKPKLAEWARERRKKPYYKLREAHRGLMRRTLDGKKSDLGYDRDALKDHMESLFVDGMSWANYGEWEIDHIKPIKVFWDEGVTDPKIVNALTNLQPLWKKDNRKKSSKWVDDTPWCL
jgi:hypothetical protein